MSADKATKTPWIVREYDDMLQITSDVDTRNVANIDWRTGIEPIDHANAELIVRAVNAHQELVDALKAVAATDMKRGWLCGPPSERPVCGKCSACKVESALARAEGK